MRFVKRVLGLVVAGLVLVSSAAAQQPEATRPTARLIFANGICFIQDPTFTDDQGIPTLAGAFEKPIPCPAVVINPALARLMPEPVVLWAIMHEIAHLVRGHSVHHDLRIRQQQEAEADCEGARWVRQYWGEMADSLVLVVQDHLQPGIVHGTPEDRARRIRECARP